MGAVRQFLEEHKGYKVNTRAEAMGVNIAETLKPKGIIIEWPPEKFTYQVALAAMEKDR